MKKLAKIVVGFLAVVFTLILAVYFALQTPPVKNFVMKSLNDFTQENYGLSVQVGRWHAGIVKGFAVNNLNVFSDSSKVLSVGRATVKIHLSQLLNKKIHIKSFLLDSLIVNTAIPEMKSETSSEWSFQIDNASITNINVGFYNKEFEFGSTDLKIYFYQSQTMNDSSCFNISAKKLFLTTFGQTVNICPFQTCGHIKADDIICDSLFARVNDFPIEGNGSYNKANQQMAGKIYGSHKFDFEPKDGQFPVKTDVFYDLEFSGDVKNPIVHSEINIKNIRINGTPINPLKLSADFAKSILSLKGQQISGDFLNLNGTVHLDSTQAFDFTMKNNVNVGLFVTALGKETRLGSSLKISGNLDKIYDAIVQGNAKLSAPNIDPLICKLNFRNKKFDLEFKQKKNYGSLSTVFKNDSLYNGHIKVNLLDLASVESFVPISHFDGNVSITGDFFGQIVNPTVFAECITQNFKMYDFPIDTLFVNAKVQDLKVDIVKSYVFGQGSLANFSDFNGDFKYHGTVSGDILNPRLNLNFKAAQIQNAIVQSDSLTGQADLYDGNLEGVFKAFSDSAEITLNLNHNLQAQSGSSRLFNDVLDGHINWTLAKEQYFNGDISCASIKELAPFLTDPQNVDGKIVGKVKIDRTNGRQQIHSKIKASKLLINSGKIDSLRMNVFFTEDSLSIMSDFFMPDSFSLMVDAGGKSPNSLLPYENGRIRGERIDMNIVNAFIPGDYKVHGLTRVNFDWMTLNSSPKFSGSMQNTDILVYWNENELLKIPSLETAYHDSTIDILPAPIWLANEKFSTKGQFKINAVKDVTGFVDLSQEAKTKARLDFSRKHNLAFLTNRVDIRPFLSLMGQNYGLDGFLTSNIKVNGENKDIDGFARISGLVLNQNGIKSGVGHFLAKINNSEILVDTLFLPLFNGMINSFGTIKNINDVPAFDLKLAVRNLDYKNKELKVKLKTADLYISGEMNNAELGGTIKIDGSTIEKYYSLQDLVALLQTAEQPKAALPDFVSNTKIKFFIDQAGKNWLHNNFIHSQYESSFQVSGTVKQPVVLGTVTFKEGYLVYFDRSFDITSGSIVFDHVDGINPLVKLDAKTNITAYYDPNNTVYTIYWKLDGRMEKFDVQLYAEPTLERADILSLLTFGATRDQLLGKYNENGNGTSDVVLNRFTMLSEKKLTDYTSRKIEKYLNLDKFTIKGSLLNTQASQATELLATKQISPKAKVTFTTSVGHLNDNTIKLDYELKPNISVEGQTDRQGNAGIDLKFQIKKP